MKRLIIIPLIFSLMLGGCGAEREKDGYKETAANTENVEKTFLSGTVISEKITEIIAEITAAITEKPTGRKSARTTHEESTVPAQITDMVDIINNKRARENLKPLKLSDYLCDVAKIRAEEASEMWSHTRTDSQRIDSLMNPDYDWTIVGENLAKYENATPQEITDAWLASETHRANLLNQRFRFCGIAQHKKGEFYYMSIVFTD